MERINVVGTSATGKTTFARRLAVALGLRHVELDALHWEAGWRAAATDVFLDRLATVMGEPGGWVVDGDYSSKARPLVWAAADTVVWLDYPMRTALARLTRRTYGRLVRREELWNGNRERWRDTFASRDSLYWWVLTTHRERRTRTSDALARPEFAHLAVRRFRSPREAESWLAEIERERGVHVPVRSWDGGWIRRPLRGRSARRS